jgi:chitin disaccharide deacetylase
MTAKIIINADDFGFCTSINRAVTEAHTNGILTSTTLMTNMPAAEEAAKIAKGLPSLGVGVHLNLLEGKALSDNKKVKVLLNPDSQFKYSTTKLALKSMLNNKIKEAIEIELAEQIQWLIDNGITPTHLDSHKHFHCFSSIYPIVCQLAKRFGIAAIRWPFEPATVCSADWPDTTAKDRRRAFIVRTMAKWNRRQTDRYVKTDFFLGLAHTGRIDEKFWAEVARTQLAGVVEIMTHPGYTDGLDPDKTRLVQQRQTELKWLCSEDIKKYLSDAGCKLIHYGQLHKETE